MHYKHHVRSVIVTTLVLGIALVMEGNFAVLRAQFASSGQGTLLLPPREESVISLVQGPLHGAAADAAAGNGGTAQLTMLLGMVLILAGFIVSYHLVCSERTVRITVKPSSAKQRRALRIHPVHERWFWVRMQL